jgi:hypothetical protein
LLHLSGQYEEILELKNSELAFTTLPNTNNPLEQCVKINVVDIEVATRSGLAITIHFTKQGEGYFALGTIPMGRNVTSTGAN